MENFRNHGPQDPSLYKRQEYIQFYEQTAPYFSEDPPVISHKDFLNLSRQAVALKHAIPKLRADIAYDMVCVGSQLPEQRAAPTKKLAGTIKEIWDLFSDLEVPDGHVVSREAADRGDFSEVERKWRQIEALIATEYQERQ